MHFLTLLALCMLIDEACSWSGLIIMGPSTVQIWSPITGAEDGTHLGLIAVPETSTVGHTTVSGARFVFSGGPLDRPAGTTSFVFNSIDNSTVPGATLPDGRQYAMAVPYGKTFLLCGGSPLVTPCLEYTRDGWTASKVVVDIESNAGSPMLMTCGNDIFLLAKRMMQRYTAEFGWVDEDEAPFVSGTYSAWVALTDTTTMVCGGDYNANGTRLCFIYSYTTNKWTETHPMLTNRSVHALVMFQAQTEPNDVGRVYAVGGIDRRTGMMIDTVEVYDPTTGWHFSPHKLLYATYARTSVAIGS